MEIEYDTTHILTQNSVTAHRGNGYEFGLLEIVSF